MRDDAYRLPARAGSALLEELAKGETALVQVLPRDAMQLTHAQIERLATLACGARAPARKRVVVAAGVPVVVGVVAQALGAPLVALLSCFAVATGLAWVLSEVGAATNPPALAAERSSVGRLPFPVDGYVFWLASAKPLFDVTLRVPVDRALFEKALRAFEPSVEVEWVDDRVARVATAPITVHSKKVGNREAFHRLVDVAKLAEESTALVKPLPREVMRLGHGRVVDLATTAVHPGGHGSRIIAGTAAPAVLGILAAALGAPAIVFMPVTALSLVMPLVMFGVSSRAARASLAAELATVEALPFPIDGYLFWLASAQPLFDVTLRAPVDHALLDKALRAFEPSVEVEWVDERVARVATTPATAMAAVGKVRFGDRAVFHRLVDKVLVPLHREVGIERIDMGGRL